MTGSVDMALDDVAAQPAVDRRGAFQIDLAADTDAAQAGAVERLTHHIGRERTVGQHVDDRETHAVHRDRIAVPGIGSDDGPADGQSCGVGQLFFVDQYTQLFNDSGEHGNQTIQSPATHRKLSA